MYYFRTYKHVIIIPSINPGCKSEVCFFPRKGQIGVMLSDKMPYDR